MLRAGFSQADITPGPDCGLVGYEFRQTALPAGNSGIHDPLRARVLVVEPPSQPRAVVVSLDLCILSVTAARRLRRIAARAAHTQPDRVIIVCTHTHSGPYPRWRGDNDIDARFSGTPAADLRYGNLLGERVRSATAAAAHLTYPVTIGTQSAPLGFAYNRRVITPAGIRRSKPNFNHPRPPTRHVPSWSSNRSTVRVDSSCGARPPTRWFSARPAARSVPTGPVRQVR
jgi:hypothetical protein